MLIRRNRGLVWVVTGSNQSPSSSATGMNAAIVWFRNDLRLADHPALTAAAKSGRPLVCIYILDEESKHHRRMGAASRWWLHHSLAALGESLSEHGASLVLRKGAAADVLPAVVRESGAGAVYWSRRYARAERETDAGLKETLRGDGLEVETFNAGLLVEPWAVETKGGSPFRVFTPFWRAARAAMADTPPLRRPGRLAAAAKLESDSLAAWHLTPARPNWAKGFADAWTPGEAGASARLADFLDQDINGYSQRRDRPDEDGTSRLSPHLHFGEISPRQILHAARHAADRGDAPARDAEKFLTELGWREFSYHLLFHQKDLSTVNVQERFDAFPWRGTVAQRGAWQKGMTGFPLVDAGMRQLWQSGWMHNRVRMVAASFLIKHLLTDWRAGEAWFWETLVDADPANNPASWQWVAGSGADAAPYFRIFNPVAQGETFDPDGDYVRRWVPELAGMPSQHIHAPWAAPAPVLRQAGVRLGDTYPEPIVDHAKARERALAAFHSLTPAG